MAKPPPRTNEEITKEFDRRSAEISKDWDEKKHKRDAVGKFAKKTAAEREQARKLKALARKATRLNERWGDNPAERERALKNHAAGKLDASEIKQVEDEIMKANGLKDRKELYSNNIWFDKLQESVGNRMRQRGGEQTREREAKRAYDQAHPKERSRSSRRSSNPYFGDTPEIEDMIDRGGPPTRHAGKPGTKPAAKPDKKKPAAKPKPKPKETAAQAAASAKAFYKALQDNPGFAKMMKALSDGAGKPVPGGKWKGVEDAINATKGKNYSDYAKKWPGMIGNPTKLADTLRAKLGKENVITYEDGSSVVLLGGDHLWKIPAPKHTEDENTYGPMGAHPESERPKKRRTARRASAAPRTFPVPATIASAWLGSSATLDEIDLAARHESEAGKWARGVQASERHGVLVGALGGATTLPFGVIVSEEDADIVVALAVPGRGIIAGAIPSGVDVEYLTLDEDEVAFALRTFNVDKLDGVILRAATPVAFLTQSAITAAVDLPPSARMIAVVDPLDKNAVLDLVAVLPGPKVLRRNDGKWEPDPSWVSILRSVRPPPVVEVTDALAASVIAQVDEATKGQPFEKTVLSSGERELFIAELEDEADNAALSLLPIIAAQGRVKSEVYDVAGVMPGQLQRYWLFGGGAAKIRWGTPGAWRRCHRELSKYMGPFKSKGACTNLGQKLGGRGVAWDVG